MLGRADALPLDVTDSLAATSDAMAQTPTEEGVGDRHSIEDTASSTVTVSGCWLSLPIVRLYGSGVMHSVLLLVGAL